MKKTRLRTSHRQWLMALLLSMVAMLSPQHASATFVDESYNYQVMLSGANTIQIQLPIYDQEDNDCWVTNAYLNYTILGGTGEKFQLLRVHPTENIDDGASTNNTEIYGQHLGWYSVSPVSGGPTILNEENDWQATCTISRPANSRHFSVTIIWTVPAELLGKSLHFEWSVWRNGNARDNDDVKLDAIDIHIPEGVQPTDPMLTQPIILPDSVGKVIIPWYIATQDVVKAEAVYQDRNNAQHTIQLEPATNGYVVLPATEPHKQLYLNVDYKDTYGYLVSNRQSSPKTDVPMIHSPVGLKATSLDDGKSSVKLEWNIQDTDCPDFLDTDFFEIQRSVTGNDEDFVTIANVLFELDSTYYSVTDSTLLSALTESDLNFFGNLPAVKYRVRRVTTSDWGWENNPCAASVAVSPHRLRLLIPENVRSAWVNESEYKIRVTWDYLKDPAFWSVWDKRAEMKLRVKIYNRNGELLETQETVLEESEVMQRYKELTLSRPCVNYEMELVVDPKSSPVLTGEKAVTISSLADWRKLKAYIEQDASLILNVQLMADLQLGQDDALGTTGYPFRGTFDGKGHTLTVADAPFYLAMDAQISNLNIAGEGLNTSGMVYLGNRVTIDNCQVRASFRGGHEAAGFCHSVYYLTIRNSLFSGYIETSNTNTRWAGFAIVRAEGTDNFYNIVNCVYSNTGKLTSGAAGGKFIYVVNAPTNPSKFQVVNSYYDSKFSDGAGIGLDKNGKPFPDTKEALLEALGSEWELCDEYPGVRPKLKTDDTPSMMVTVPVAGLANNPTFYHESTGKVEKTLIPETRQSSVLLTWETDGGVVDYFSVWRRELGSDDDFEPIAPSVDNTSYEDKDVSPLLSYEYKVRSYVDCEGLHYEETDVVVGRCKDTGQLEGYIRFSDGSAAAGITVVVYHNDREVARTVTDDSGYYMVEGLSYNGEKSVDYTVGPVNSGSMHHTFNQESFPVQFGATSNYEKVPDFMITSGYRFSGFVMYEGTSIPVKGAQFFVNGHKVTTSAGKPLETDFEGKYSFYVGAGDNVIQVVKDGHTFANNGYYKSENGINIDENKSLQYFYDQTKVKLIGRIVGGDTQGDLPLDNNLSRNNLGSGLKMVLTLEGDNSSWLVYDNLHPNVSEHDTVFVHNNNDASQTYLTKVHTNRKRMVVMPDSLTGEYNLYLPPVRWKVQQVYNDGYSTLFQDGMVSEVIDLTDCTTAVADTVQGLFLTPKGTEVRDPIVRYHAKYNRIYHAPVELLRKQITYDKFDYVGEKVYVAQCVDGTKSKVPLVYEDANSPDGVTYTFGYPVFNLNRTYPIRLSAVERYYWNNHTQSDTVDVVKVGGGKVIVHNGLKDNTHREEVTLDGNGEGVFNLQAEQMTRLLTGDDALRTVTFTLEQDGSTFETTPIKGYLLNYFALQEGKDLLGIGTPLLVDILRDPPGGGSSATLHRGSTMDYGYSMDLTLKAGLSFALSYGTTLDNFAGAVSAPGGIGTTYGLTHSSDTKKYIDYQYIINSEGNRSFNYSVTVEDDVTTSSSINMVGATADIYMGMMQNIVMTTASTIRAIPDSIFRQMAGKLPGGVLPTGGNLKYGSLVEIAQGRDANDSIYHLVRDESLLYGPKVESNFFYTQKYILNQLIPEHLEFCRSLMFTGTAAEAQARANATGQPVYLALRQPTDSLFGAMNVKNGTDYYYTNEMPDEKDMNYRMYLPQNTGKDYPDEVAEHWNVVLKWIAFIAQNEKEKYTASELVRNFNLDGGSSVSYSEDFESEYSISTHLAMPGIKGASFYEDEVGGDYDMKGAGLGALALKTINPLLSSLLAQMEKTFDKDANINGMDKSMNNDYEVSVRFSGKNLSFRILPVMDYSTKGEGSKSLSYSRSESFDIDFENGTHLDFDVYRATASRDQVSNLGDYDVFTRQGFDHLASYNTGFITRDIDMSKALYPKGFVYRTRGGATARPWENVRKTHFFMPGTVLDERTKKIENPKISLDKQSISGVPYGEPARFKVYLTNESEKPEAATGGMAFFNFYLSEPSNTHGAKLFVDGMPLTGEGRLIRLEPGKITEKVLEVYAGEEFDYENLVVGLMSQEDFVNACDEVSFDVHFLRQAGDVQISSPSDKWVMNTDASYNEDRGYFIPVTISGFNKYQKNFDHIEFQYKQTARGDDYWTNLCSYYADSTLMAKSNGVCEMIPENGNITTKFYGDEVVTEEAYDLRAVLYCRDGNSFLTTASKVLSGIKDTRRPQLFGEPEPVDGILDIGESIVFNFTEDIEYNFLKPTTHFEVKGEVNNDNVNEHVSLQFDGKASMETEAKRNFFNKDLTIEMLIKPDDTDSPMPLFSHGTGGKKLQLWLTEKKHLRAVVDNQTYETQAEIVGKGFTQVAMVIQQPNLENGETNWHLRLLNGGTLLGDYVMTEPYTGTGTLIFGRTNDANRNKSKYYKGRMKEARLWYRALTATDLSITYGFKRLSGYELGLVDYYPMEEGSGNYALDKSQGAHATLINTTWAMPHGMSLHINKEDRGIALKTQALARTADEDYTLMFWFKTDKDGKGALISNGSGHATDIGAKSQFYIGFEANQLTYRSNGMEVKLPGSFADNDWHHYAMTVNRSHNMVNIYVDKTLLAAFKADSLGGIAGGHLLLGASVYEEMSDGKVNVVDTRNWLTGNIDEICLFEQSLPLSLIEAYSTKSPNGDEAGLLTYLSFDRQERVKDNDIIYVPYLYSRKIYKDKGNIVYELDPETHQPTDIPQRDYLFVDNIEKMTEYVDDGNSAPVMPYEELHNLDFSFAGRNNQLMVNINEQETLINHRHVYVTIREIPDKNGNNIASPVTACFYVDRSPLKWTENNMAITMAYGEEIDLTLGLQNNSGANHTYTIDNIPVWMTLDNKTGLLTAKEATFVTATVNKHLNVGTYDEVIYLKDENGFTEPLYLTLVVEGDEPEWAVNRELGGYTMNVTGRVLINDEIDTDPRDIVGVFDSNNVCHGVARVEYDEKAYDNLVYLTIYNDKNDKKQLYFKLWRYDTGLEMLLQPDTITFQASKSLGLEQPVEFNAGAFFVQTLHLKKGWNWVSFYVFNDKTFSNANTLLSAFPWKEGDALTDNTENHSLVFRDGAWLNSDGSKTLSIRSSRSYCVNVQQDIDVPIAGAIISESSRRTITVDQGWNSIGYTPMLNLTVETALSSYYDSAEEGDIIKSHDEFAYFTRTKGVGHWQGNLKYMVPGEGYMLHRKGQGKATFIYPFFEPGSTFLDEIRNAPASGSIDGGKPFTMSVTAIATGVELEPGDRLMVYAEGDLRGVSSAYTADSLFYLSVEGDREEPLSFAIEREGDIIATTGELLKFGKNQVLGTPSIPTRIDFVRRDIPKAGWYTLDGIKLDKRPVKKGVYIFNGKKKVIEN